MKRALLAPVLALVLCAAVICGAFAEAAPQEASAMETNWYTATAIRMAEEMNALADNEAYVELFIGMGEDTDGFADQMAALKGLEPEAVYIYYLREDALNSYAEAYQMDEFTLALSQPQMRNLTGRMNQSLGSLLNSHVGGNLWLAIASALSYTETFRMPEGFAPQAQLLCYVDQPAAVLVTYTQTGEDTITAQATFVRSNVYEDPVAQSVLDLMWEQR